MHAGTALVSGLAGACTLTLVHEAARHSVPHAPQVHVIGERALRRSARAVGSGRAEQRSLYGPALVGELISNGLYYSLVGIGGARHAVQVGAVMGAVAGVGAVTLPPRMGLGRQPDRKSPVTELMTIAWYTLGGLAAGLAYRRLDEARNEGHEGPERHEEH